MIIVGERLNSTRKPVLDALIKRDETFICQEARDQEKAGASYIDLNAAALLDKENESLSWAIPIIQKAVTIPLSIDTPNQAAMEHGLKIHEGKAFMNSMSGETKKIEAFLPLIKNFKPKVIVLCLDDSGLPETADDVLRIVNKMTDFLDKQGMDADDIFFDPLVRTIGIDQKAARLFLDSLKKIKDEIPRVKTIAGISNISYGLPQRSALNRTLLSLAVESGLDAAMIDPLDQDLLCTLRATQAILGMDPDLRDYISAVKTKLT
jgi:5-methyltetrahydrofolate--homocysteine methyltransferase